MLFRLQTDIAGHRQAKTLQHIFILLFLLGLLHPATCTAEEDTPAINEFQVIELSPDASMAQDVMERPSPLWQIFKKRQMQNKKITAALLAFPFPFGIVGLHRIYLGCAPYVPVVYIASLGGAFGLLPLLDCVVLLASKDITPYVNNKMVFMWVK